MRSAPARCDGDDLPACAIGNDFRESQHAALLRFEPGTAPFVAPLIGWTGGTDTLSQLDFPSAEAAVAYAKRQGFNFIVRVLQRRRRITAR